MTCDMCGRPPEADYGLNTCEACKIEVCDMCFWGSERLRMNHLRWLNRDGLCTECFLLEADIVEQASAVVMAS